MFYQTVTECPCYSARQEQVPVTPAQSFMGGCAFPFTQPPKTSSETLQGSAPAK